MKKRALLISVVLFFLSVIYSIIWFYAARNLEILLKEVAFKKENQLLEFEKVKVSGFPFKLKAKVYNLKYHFHYTEEPTSKFTANFTANSLSICSNILFNKFSFHFPKESMLNVIYDDKFSNIKLISNDEHYIQIKEDHFINLYRVIKHIKDIEKIQYDDITVKQVKYYSKNLDLINESLNKKIVNMDSDFEVNLGYRSDKLRNLALDSSSNINIGEDSSFKKDSNNIITNIKLETKLKPDDEGDTFSILAAKVDNLDLKFNSTKLTFSGEMKDHVNDNLFIEFNLSITDFNNFINLLLSNGKISAEKANILKEAFKAISGSEDIDNINIRIYNSKDGFIKIGNTDMDSLRLFFQQFLTSD
ncbi:MAG: hypothetical protein AABY27_02425 [Pseudomonadota bacterium]